MVLSAVARELRGVGVAYPGADSVSCASGAYCEEASTCRPLTRSVARWIARRSPSCPVELLAEDTVLPHEVIDDGLLSSVHPPGERQQEEVQWGDG